jgi:hypothetical protein
MIYDDVCDAHSTRTTSTSGHALSSRQPSHGPTSSVDTVTKTTKPRHGTFAELDARFGRHSLDRFSSALTTLLPPYNAGWRHPACKAVDALHILDDNWRKENNWYNIPQPLLPNLVPKLRRSGAATTMVAPRWTGKAWHQALTEMASKN